MLLDEKDKPSPMDMIVGKKEVQWIPRAHYQERSSWLIPAETRYLNYHVGIFGSTGCGKSYLARFSLIPMFLEAKYRVLVLDWSGVDYAPFYGDRTTLIRDVALDEAAVVDYLATKMQHFGYRGQYRTDNPIRDELEDFVGDDWQARITKGVTPKALRASLHDSVLAGLQASAGTKATLLQGWTRSFERGFKKLTDDHMKVVMGKKTIEDLVSGLKDISVIDMHEVGTDEKLSFFATLANHLTDLMDSGQELKLALVIDESPQYCVSPDTIIQTANGDYSKIDDMGNRVGDSVLGLDNKLRTSSDTIQSFYRVNLERVKLRTTRGDELIVSTDTRLLSLDEEGKLMWKAARELEKGETIALIRKQPEPPQLHSQLPSNDLLYLAGLVASDGCLSRSNGGSYIEFSNKNMTLQRNFVSIVERMTGKRPKVRRKGYGTYCSRIGNKKLFLQLMSLGIPVGKKYALDIPRTISAFPNESVKSYIRGCFDGDGSVDSKKRRVLFCTGSLEYATKMRLLLLRFEISSSLGRSYSYSFSKKARTTNMVYNVTLWGTNAISFAKKIGFGHPAKARKAGEMLKKPVSDLNHSHADSIPNQGMRLRSLRTKAKIGRIRFGIENTRESNVCAIGRASLSQRIAILVGAGLATTEPELGYLQTLADSDVRWVPLSSVTQIGIGPLCDFTIFPDSNYIANGFVVHNCPWEPRGLQVEATELIKGLCALGRKHKLSVVMLSQGISGDIGINAAVRRNLNTQFFGRIHPLDMMEAGNWLAPYGISPDDLLSMEPGYFYYSGRMNPSPIPLLMTFTIED
jgi:intein/homing endonuclease